MRKLIFIFSFLTATIISYSQSSKVTVNGSTPSNMMQVKGTISVDSGLYLAKRDTLNSPYKDSVGLLYFRPQDKRAYISQGGYWRGLAYSGESNYNFISGLTQSGNNVFLGGLLTQPTILNVGSQIFGVTNTTGGSTSGSLVISTTGFGSSLASIGANIAGIQNNFDFMGNGTTIYNDRNNSQGIQYGGDYESNFGNRSLITKQYFINTLQDTTFNAKLATIYVASPNQTQFVKTSPSAGSALAITTTANQNAQNSLLDLISKNNTDGAYYDYQLQGQTPATGTTSAIVPYMFRSFSASPNIVMIPKDSVGGASGTNWFVTPTQLNASVGSGIAPGIAGSVTFKSPTTSKYQGGSDLVYDSTNKKLIIPNIGEVSSNWDISQNGSASFAGSNATIDNVGNLSAINIQSANIMQAHDTLFADTKVVFSGLPIGNSTDSVVTVDGTGNIKKRNANSFGTTYTAGYGITLPGNAITVDSATLSTKYLRRNDSTASNGYVTPSFANNNYFPLVGGSITGTAGAGYVGFPTQISNPGTITGQSLLFRPNTGLGFFAIKHSNGFVSYLNSSLTADRTYRFPDSTGTLALLQNIPSSTGFILNNQTQSPQSNSGFNIQNKGNIGDSLINLNQWSHAGVVIGDSIIVQKDSIAFYGASVEVGSAASDSAHRWTTQAGVNLGSFPWIRAIGGTAFQRATVGDSSFMDRLYTIPNYRSTIRYIVIGVSNLINDCDLGRGSATLSTAMSNAIDTISISRGFPLNRIIMATSGTIGLNSFGKNRDSLKPYIDTALAVARRKGVQTVDIFNYFINNGATSWLSSDSIHPNNSGHDGQANAFIYRVNTGSEKIRGTLTLTRGDVVLNNGSIYFPSTDSSKIGLIYNNNQPFAKFQTQYDNGLADGFQGIVKPTNITATGMAIIAPTTAAAASQGILFGIGGRVNTITQANSIAYFKGDQTGLYMNKTIFMTTPTALINWGGNSTATNRILFWDNLLTSQRGGLGSEPGGGVQIFSYKSGNINLGISQDASTLTNSNSVLSIVGTDSSAKFNRKVLMNAPAYFTWSTIVGSKNYLTTYDNGASNKITGLGNFGGDAVRGLGIFAQTGDGTSLLRGIYLGVGVDGSTQDTTNSSFGVRSNKYNVAFTPMEVRDTFFYKKNITANASTDSIGFYSAITGAATKGAIPRLYPTLDTRYAQTGSTGTVTSFSSGNLSPLFTTSVTTATITPALSFSLSTQTANTIFAGPTSGGAAAPTFRSLGTTDIPNLATLYVQNTASPQSSSGFNISDNGIIGGLATFKNYYTTSTTPSISAGTGAGTSPTVSITGTNNDGFVTITTGTLPTLSATIATITLSGAFAFPNGSSVTLTPRNANAAILSGAQAIFATGGTSTWTMTAGATALTASTTYIYNYHIGGY